LIAGGEVRETGDGIAAIVGDANLPAGGALECALRPEVVDMPDGVRDAS